MFVVSKAIKLIIVSVCEVTEKRLNVEYNKQKKRLETSFVARLGLTILSRLRFPHPLPDSDHAAAARDPKRQKNKEKNSLFFCDPLGVRTQDPILKRDVLYLLS